MPPFSDYLTKKELMALFKSYGMPEKPAVWVFKLEFSKNFVNLLLFKYRFLSRNARQALISKFRNEAIDIGESKNAYQYSLDKYNKLSEEEKSEFMNQYHEVTFVIKNK